MTKYYDLWQFWKKIRQEQKHPDNKPHLRTLSKNARGKKLDPFHVRLRIKQLDCGMQNWWTFEERQFLLLVRLKFENPFEIR